MMRFLSWLVELFREYKKSQRKEQTLRRRFPTAKISSTAEIRNPDRLSLGKNVMIDSNVLLHCGGYAWSEGNGSIKIGNDCYIGPNSVLFGAGDIEIGNDVLISPNVTITSHQHTYEDASVPMRMQPAEFKKVVIEDNVWIGSNAVILPGVKVGCGAIIGAGAVVTKDVESFGIVAGIPATLYRFRNKIERK